MTVFPVIVGSPSPVMVIATGFGSAERSRVMRIVTVSGFGSRSGCFPAFATTCALTVRVPLSDGAAGPDEAVGGELGKAGCVETVMDGVDPTVSVAEVVTPARPGVGDVPTCAEEDERAGCTGEVNTDAEEIKGPDGVLGGTAVVVVFAPMDSGPV